MDAGSGLRSFRLANLGSANRLRNSGHFALNYGSYDRDVVPLNGLQRVLWSSWFVAATTATSNVFLCFACLFGALLPQSVLRFIRPQFGLCASNVRVQVHPVRNNLMAILQYGFRTDSTADAADAD